MSPLNTESNRIAFRSMFEHVSLGIIVVDGEGVIQQVNPYANRLFGYYDKELTGQKIEILIPQKLHKQHVDHRSHYHENPKPRSMGIGMDLSAVRKDGSEFPVEISLASYEVDGKRQAVSFISDITARKKAEDDLKKLNAQLEDKVEERTKELSQALLELHHINEDLVKAVEKEKELSELKSRFVSMASHEFRTPLGGILTSASLIGRYEKAEEQDKRERHINTIKASVKNLTSILNDFLSLDKLEGGKIECRPSTFSFTELIQEIIPEMESIAKKGQRIIQHDDREGTSPSENNQVTLDRDMLRNVLINLLSNATKYSPEDSEIKLKTTLQPTQVTIAIQDSGIGIPKSDQKHLFEKFFRAKNATTVQGTGLGLNIIKRYLDLMQGSIAFTSQEGKGSLFTITLPREIK